MMSFVAEKDLKKLLIRSMTKELDKHEIEYSLDRVEDFYILTVNYLGKDYELHLTSNYD